MGKPTTKVDADALRAMGQTLTTEADGIGALDVAPPLANGAAAMPASALGPTLTAAGDAIKKAYKDVSDQLRRMGSAAAANANDYEAADRAFKEQLTALTRRGQ